MKNYTKTLRDLAEMYKQKSPWLRQLSVEELLKLIADTLDDRYSETGRAKPRKPAARVWKYGEGLCPLGACKVFWKSGGTSQAIVYQDATGERFINCANWISGASSMQDAYESIHHIQYYEESL